MSEVFSWYNDIQTQLKSTEKISALSYKNNLDNNKIINFQNKFQDNLDWQNLTQKQNTQKETLLNQKIQLYERIINQTKQSLIDLQKNKDNSNDLITSKIDNFMSLFSNETPSKIYEESFEITKNQASILLPRIKELLNDENINWENLLKLQKLESEIQIILKLNIKDTSILTLTKNQILNTPENLKLTAYWVKWEVIWILDWAKNIITWTFDLIVWLWKYVIYQEYRENINIQIWQIYDFCVENWFTWMKDIFVNAINTEIDRVSKLPKEEQAEAIWKIAWNVIAIIWTFKVWWMITKELKTARSISTATSFQEKLKIWSVIVWLNTANIIVNWPEEYLLKWAWKWIWMISDKINNLIKIKWLQNVTRIDLAETILWWVKLNKSQIEAIELAHKTQNLNQKVKILSEAWFDKNSRELLIRNYVCWWEISDILKSISKYSIDYKYAEINELQKALDLWNTNLSELSNKLESTYENILKLVENPKIISSEKWREIIKETLLKIKNDIHDKESVEKFGKIVWVLKDWFEKSATSPERKELAEQIIKEFESFYDNAVEIPKKMDNVLNVNKELKVSQKYIWEFEKFYKKLEVNELLVEDFKRNIDEFNWVKWWIKKPKNPKLLKERIKIEIEKFEIWQNYRKEKFWVSNELLEIANKKFFESVNPSLTFQLKKEVKFTNFKELNLFINKK